MVELPHFWPCRVGQLVGGVVEMNKQNLFKNLPEHLVGDDYVYFTHDHMLPN